MKRASVVISDHEHGRTWGHAFAKGLERHGWNVGFGFNPSDLCVFWGARYKNLIEHQSSAGGEVCILECGYVGDRLNWTSVSFGGGLNGRGKFRGALDDPARWNRHFSSLMKPWRRERTGVALILGQVPGDLSVEGVDLEAFYDWAKRVYAKQCIETRYRPHPLVRQTRSLDLDLADAQFVVTWNSNSAVDAVLAGVPAVALDRGSMAWPVATHSLTVPITQFRHSWSHALAWKQWRLDEMRGGECWDHIRGDL